MNLRIIPILFAVIIAFLSCSGNIESNIYKSENTAFTMIEIPLKTFPTMLDNSTTVSLNQAFGISEAEVTYELWRAVYEWATSPERGDKAYDFLHEGRPGGGFEIGRDEISKDESLHPVTEISWHDCLVWTNALTEWCNAGSDVKLTVVYYSDAGFTTPLRSSLVDVKEDTKRSLDSPFVKTDATGFRFPYKDEWELAARYIGDFNNDGDISDQGEFYRGNCASGSIENIYNETATCEVAWFGKNSGGVSHRVKTRKPTAIGLYDMSGNVYEWCFEWDSKYVGENRVYRGASWAAGYRQVGVGFLYYNGAEPSFMSDSLGFRVAKNVVER